VNTNGRSLAEILRTRGGLSSWTARHDNGWITTVLETPYGTYAAWAAPDAETASVDYVEDSPERAQIAALTALKLRTGHERCSAACSGWQHQTHRIGTAASLEP
jgi:hypothetical protein